MPTLVSISIVVACICIVAMMVLAFVLSLHFSRRLSAIENQLASLNGEVTGFVREGGAVFAQTTVVLGKVEAQIEDVQYVTRTARGWVSRADGLLEGVGKFAEPSLFFVSKKMHYLRSFAGGFLESITNHKKQ